MGCSSEPHNATISHVAREIHVLRGDYGSETTCQCYPGPKIHNLLGLLITDSIFALGTACFSLTSPNQAMVVVEKRNFTEHLNTRGSRRL